MGIQINGSTDTISAIDGSLTLEGGELRTVSGLSVTGVVTATSYIAGAGSTSAPSITPSGDSNTGIFFPSADTIAFGEGGVEAARIDSSGNLGVGTDSPNYTLHLHSSATSDSNYLQITHADAGSTSGDGLQFGLGTGSNPIAYLAQKENADLVIQTNATERARIDSSGRLLVGTSTARNTYSPQDGVTATPTVQIEGANQFGSYYAADNTTGSRMFLAKARASMGLVSNGDELGLITFCGSDGNFLRPGGAISCLVDGTASAAGAGDMPGRLVFSTTSDGLSTPTPRMKITSDGQLISYADAYCHAIRTNATPGTTYSLISGWYSATSLDTGTNSFRVWSNGNVQNTNNSYGALSDIKLKENIVDASSQWDDLKAIQVRNYNFKEGQTHTQLGVVAQEIELVSPGLVTESPDVDEEGNDLGTVTKSVNYSVLYMKAVKALQEAMERIETLETANASQAATIAALDARLTALEGA